MATTTEEEAMEVERRPVHKLRYGAVDCAIWADNSLSGYFYNTTFSKTYKAGDVWRHSQSFDDRDLPNLAKAAMDAHTWIQSRKNEAAIVSGDHQD
jgi:hypothetical protein